MTTIYIKDTGIIKPGGESGTAYTGLDIVNAGNELPLKITTLKYGRGISFDNTPSPGTDNTSATNTLSYLNFISVNNAIITLTGNITTKGILTSSDNIINKITSGDTTSIKDYDNSDTSNEVEILYLLDRLILTKGYKELYYKEDVVNNMLYGIGKKDSHTTTGSTYRHLHIRIKSIAISESPSTNLISWTMVCEVERGE